MCCVWMCDVGVCLCCAFVCETHKLVRKKLPLTYKLSRLHTDAPSRTLTLTLLRERSHANAHALTQTLARKLSRSHATARTQTLTLARKAALLPIHPLKCNEAPGKPSFPGAAKYLGTLPFSSLNLIHTYQVTNLHYQKLRE